MKRLLTLSAWVLLFVLAGCGGGGGSSGSSGSGGSTGTSSTNSVALAVGSGPTGKYANLVMASVTVCVPGTSTCTTIPNVMIDTGSSGLRLLASHVGVALPGVASASGGYAECAAFADGVVWGPLALADVQLAGEKASSISVHLLRDNSVGAPIPAACSAQGTEEDSLAALGVSGILGIGPMVQDCGVSCAQVVQPTYFDCDKAGNCTQTTLALASQVSNPVASFAQDNNGTVLSLDQIPTTGATSGTGTLTFGIGTQSNNGLTAPIIPLDPSTGYFTAVLNGTSLPASLIDSGSTALFFNDNIAQCDPAQAAAGYYCPGSSSALSSVSVSASLMGTSGSPQSVTVSVANALYLFTGNSNAVFNNLAGPGAAGLSNGFDFGVPFFYGKQVYTAIENRGTPNGTGPFVAFQ